MEFWKRFFISKYFELWKRTKKNPSNNKILFKDVEKSLKSRCLTSHTTWTLNTKIWVHDSYNMLRSHILVWAISSSLLDFNLLRSSDPSAAPDPPRESGYKVPPVGLDSSMYVLVQYMYTSSSYYIRVPQVTFPGPLCRCC